jgi:hypothetical protein
MQTSAKIRMEMLNICSTISFDVIKVTILMYKFSYQLRMTWFYGCEDSRHLASSTKNTELNIILVDQLKYKYDISERNHTLNLVNSW